MTSIAIVGSGVSGLHLGLFLAQHDVPVTIYTDKSAEQIAAGRLLNTVAHHHHTLERERALGVHHWDANEYGYGCHHHSIVGAPEPMRFRGDSQAPTSQGRGDKTTPPRGGQGDRIESVTCESQDRWLEGAGDSHRRTV